MDFIEFYVWNQDHFDLIPFNWKDLVNIYIRSNAIIIKDSDFASVLSQSVDYCDIPTEKGLYFWQLNKDGWYNWVNAEEERWCKENETY